MNNVFPQAWEISRTSPIPKADNLSENSNYRAVAVMLILLKVCEGTRTNERVY